VHFRELLDSNRHIRFAFKLFALILGIAILLELGRALMPDVPAGAVVLLLMVSVLAYRARERRNPRREQRRPGGGHERTPMVPHF
jgi:dolichol kinase